MTTNDVAAMYDALLSVPGMNVMVKIDLKISCKQVLLLSQAIRQGLSKEGMVKELLSVLPKETGTEATAIADDFLQKAGLSELYGKLMKMSV
jgi:hypothetical protein